MVRRFTWLAALSLVLVLVVAACGETHEQPGAQPDAPSPTAVEDDEEEPEADPEGDAEDPGDAADELAEFYSGQTLTIMTTHAAGSTADVHSRALAEYLPRYIPGEPRAIVENMTGGGQNIGVQWLYSQAEPDGLAIGTFSSHRILASILGEEGAEYDVSALTWIGTTAAGPSICGAWHTSGFESVEDFETNDTPWRLGARAPSDVTHTIGMMMVEDLGYDVEVILGYEGIGEISLALEQEELNGACHPYGSIFGDRPEWEEEGLFVPLFVVGPTPSVDLPDLPTVLDLPWSDEHREGITAYVQRFEILVPVAAPPGVPADRTEALRRALEQTVQDPEFVDHLAQVGQRVENPMNGEELEQVIQDLYDTPESVWETVLRAQQ